DQGGMRRKCSLDRYVPLRDPDCKYERQSSPFLPDLAEVVGVRISRCSFVQRMGRICIRRQRAHACLALQQERCITDHESRFMWLVMEARYIADRGGGG